MQLTLKQLAALESAIAPKLGYLFDLRTRMDKVGFIPDDKMRRLVEDAYNAMHSLRMHVHELAIEVERQGRDPEKRPWE